MDTQEPKMIMADYCQSNDRTKVVIFFDCEILEYSINK